VQAQDPSSKFHSKEILNLNLLRAPFVCWRQTVS